MCSSNCKPIDLGNLTTLQRMIHGYKVERSTGMKEGLSANSETCAAKDDDKTVPSLVTDPNLAILTTELKWNYKVDDVITPLF